MAARELSRKDNRSHAPWALVAMSSFVLALVPADARATTFVVNTSADLPDFIPGNNICESSFGSGLCALRTAIIESNGHPGPDSIVLQANTTYLLTLTGEEDLGFAGDLDIIDSVTITAAGPMTVIDGNGAVTQERVFTIAECNRVGSSLDGTCGTGGLTASISGIAIRRGRSLSGGAILNFGALSLSNCTITDNRVDGLGSYGGGVFNLGSLTITNCTISNNSANDSTSRGGGIYSASPMTIVESTIRGNTTPGAGGGLYVVGLDTIVKGSTISGNTAAIGGGMFVQGDAAIVNSTISGNFSFDYGAGIVATFGVTALFNSTVALNLANADSSGTAIGGGVYNAFGSTLNLFNSAVSLNESELPGSPFPTILPDDCAGAINSQANNIISDVNPNHCTVNGAYAPTYANLGPLQDNGGPTFTHALVSPSAAIDAGNIAGCTNHIGQPLTIDQRGFLRPQGPRCDIGAFEVSDRAFADGFES